MIMIASIHSVYFYPPILLAKATFSKKGRLFTEGWVEFADKKVAKQVAAILNNTQVPTNIQKRNFITILFFIRSYKLSKNLFIANEELKKSIMQIPVKK